MKKIFIVIFYFSVRSSYPFPNGWQPLGNGLSNYATSMYIDSNNNLIYVGGRFDLADSIDVNGIAAWDGNRWDSLGGGNVYNQLNFAITKYQNQIYSDGRFVLGNTSNYGASFNGISWDSLGDGVNGPIYQMKEINGDLWISGFFYSAGGNNCSMLATWNGATWNCFNVPYLNAIHDFHFYNNQLVIGGNFYDSLGNNVDIAYYDGLNYQPLGHRIYGGTSYINAMTVFRGDLYVGGYFLTANGNEGNCIMRWDGNQWFDVGGGMDNRVDCFYVLNDELLVGGGFHYAGGVYTGNLAKWNGSQWSEVTPSKILGEVYAIDYFQNELYVAGGFWTIDSVTVNHIAKYTGPLEIVETDITKNIFLSPSPTHDHLKITSPQINIHSSTIFDITGKLLLNKETNAGSFQLDVSSLAAGLYFLVLDTPKGAAVKKFVKE